MEKSANVEILIIGNEILTGDIPDTNTTWLCKMVHERGGSIARVMVLPDIAEVVADAVRDAVRRQVDILFTSGGLGPTFDDLTLQAVAMGTDREVTIHPEAVEMIQKQSEYFLSKGSLIQGDFTQAREKMACLPHGADPLLNSAGMAPGVFLQVDQTAIISLPGVPSELKQIVSQSLKQFLDGAFGEGGALSRRISVTCGGESLVEPAVLGVMEQYPEIYIKSLATAIGESPELDIIMTVAGIGEKEELLEKAVLKLCNSISELGYSVRIKS